MRQGIDYQALMSLYQESRMSVTASYQAAPEVITVNGSVVGTLGNFSASIGKAKSKKTFNVSAMVAAAISGLQVLNYQVTLPEEKDKILYVDTEQGKHHCQKVLKRIHRLAGLSVDKDSDRLQFLSLRKYTPEERIGIIELALQQTSGLGLVIIDGIRDCLYDINSPAEATKIVTLLMQWTDEYQIHLHTILHQNKGDENARGHIGTEINNKAETVLQVEKDKNDPNISKVEAIHCRDREFEPFAFRVDDRGLPVLVDGYVFTPSGGTRPEKFDPYRDITEGQHKEALDKIFVGGRQLSRKELEDEIKNVYSQVFMPIGDNKVTALITFLSNKRLILHSDPSNSKSRWVLNPLGKY